MMFRSNTRRHYEELCAAVEKEFGYDVLNEIILKSNAIALGIAVQIYPKKNMRQCIGLEERDYSRKLHYLRDLVCNLRKKNINYNIHKKINDNYAIFIVINK